MFGCDCFHWNTALEFHTLDGIDPEPFSLPTPLPNWPQGQGFAGGKICLGEIEVIKITNLERMWSSENLYGKTKGISFYKPIGVPEGFFCLGYYCQSNDQPLRGHVLAAQDISASKADNPSLPDSTLDFPALKKPRSYSLIWTTESDNGGDAFFWLPVPPLGYKATGILVSDKPDTPTLDEVRCVRADLTETCEVYDLLLNVDSKISKLPFMVWKTRPCKRGMFCRGVSIGTFFCSSFMPSPDEVLNIACLKNFDSTLHAMPNLNQIHALIEHYGPTVFFHPDEVYLPSSVPWFFKNGALLCQDGQEEGRRIDSWGSNLPRNGENDGEFWIDLPHNDDKRNSLKYGNLESAELYVHVKPALGGTFTDIAMWVFCPFNGPATLKVGPFRIELNKIGEHVGDWEHFTLRVSNLTGELWSVYFSQHSGGVWVDAHDLEFVEGNKPIVYSSKAGHASFPHPGTHIQGSSKAGIGVRNDAARSKYFVDSSSRYYIMSAEYLGEGVVNEPCWLQYMREWGPKITYDAWSELNKVMRRLPIFLQFSVETLFELFPTEIYGEEGPTGPKEKNNWVGDERW